MRKRRLRLALLAVALLGVVAWLVWPTTPAAVTAAKEKYARLQLGMSEAEAFVILGDTPELDRQLYGEWIADLKLYRFASPIFTPSGSTAKLLAVRGWTFGGEDRSGWWCHGGSILGVFDQGRLVSLQYSEVYDNTAKRWLRELADRLSLRPTWLTSLVREDHKAIPPP